MTIRILSIDENMEDMRKRLSKETSHPAFIISRHIIDDSDCRYREQHEDEYRKRSTLEMSLAQLRSSDCVGRVDYPEYTDKCGNIIPRHSIRKFELSLSNTLYFAVPVINSNDLEKDFMKCIGIGMDNGVSSIRLSQNEVVCDELKPFVQEIKTAFGPNKKYTGIRFFISHEFMRPNIYQSKWHLGDIQPNYQFSKNEEVPNTEYTRIHAPGRYSSAFERSSTDEVWSQMIVCKRKPGPCVVCHGSSKEENHFGPKTFGLICKACLPKACREWIQIINQF